MHDGLHEIVQGLIQVVRGSFVPVVAAFEIKLFGFGCGRLASTLGSGLARLGSSHCKAMTLTIGEDSCCDACAKAPRDRPLCRRAKVENLGWGCIWWTANARARVGA